MAKKIINYDEIPAETVDELWSAAINGQSGLSKDQFEWLRKRWHELHDGEMKGV